MTNCKQQLWSDSLFIGWVVFLLRNISDDH
jgi:hypothetical protein